MKPCRYLRYTFVHLGEILATLPTSRTPNVVRLSAGQTMSRSTLKNSFEFYKKTEAFGHLEIEEENETRKITSFVGFVFWELSVRSHLARSTKVSPSVRKIEKVLRKPLRREQKSSRCGTVLRKVPFHASTPRAQGRPIDRVH